MKKQFLVMYMAGLAGLSSLTLSNPAQSAEVAPAPNGIAFPAGYQNWRVVAVSERIDNNTLRVIVGNDTAIKAARSGKTNPWPNGTILGKVVWKQAKEEHWPTAIVPTDFVHAEFMLKDSEKYSATGGWGYARWKGPELKPYGKDKNFTSECLGCHTPMKNNDYVFTKPAPFFPKLK